MKTTFTFLLLFVMATAFAQTNTVLPRTEFVISLSETSLSLKPGETRQVMIEVLRSRSFAKAKATLGVSSVLPQGITVSFEPTEGDFQSGVATITAAPNALIGTYSLVLNGTINYKTKGAILKLAVANENVASK